LSLILRLFITALEIWTVVSSLWL